MENAYKAKLEKTLKTLNPNKISSNEYAEEIGKYRQDTTGEDKSQYGRLMELHNHYQNSYCSKKKNVPSSTLDRFSRCLPPND